MLEAGVFSVLLLIGSGLIMAMILDIPIPNPTNIMERLFVPFTTWINQTLSDS